MNDLMHASTLFVVFAMVLMLYGAALVRTGDKNLLPARAIHSVRGPHDVRRVGRITMRVGLVIGILALATWAFSHF